MNTALGYLGNTEHESGRNMAARDNAAVQPDIFSNQSVPEEDEDEDTLRHVQEAQRQQNVSEW